MERYEIVGLLGTGGMGQVYRAFDATLNREVALKRLRGGADATQRLLREARAQARIRHPHICRVLEVGEERGKTFIAMELVEGRSLDRLAPELSTREKVMILRQVAGAVAAAHGEGLIHRDLKPANVMVERRQDQWHAYVMDFGLAVDPREPGLTATGTILGSVPYMAPEQARGDRDTLDARTDVYGLGAILYEILSGSPPHAGDSQLEILASILRRDPPPLAQKMPKLARDLRAVVAKCLERRPARRYGSARALARDLDRFLAGEGVEAREPSRFERGLRFLTRHRAITATVALSALLLMAVGAVAVRTSLEARGRARLAQRLGAEVEAITTRWRLIEMSPQRDQSADLERLRRRIADLETPGDDATSAIRLAAAGRARLELGEAGAAIPRLRRARHLGDQSLTTSLALARALVERYRAELVLIERIRDEDLQAARRAGAEKALRDPALALLSGVEEKETEHYSQALLKILEGDFDSASTLLAEARRLRPWLFESYRLEGEIARQRARLESDIGAARVFFEAAREALKEATRRAPGSAGAWTELCSIFNDQLALGLDDAAAVESWRAEALEACTVPTGLRPHESPRHEELASLHIRLAINQRVQGGDAEPDLLAATAAINRALEIDGQSSRAWQLRGLVSRRRSNQVLSQGGDPAAHIEAARDAFERAVTIAPRWEEAWNGLGNVALDQAEYAAALGEDGRQDLRAGIDAFGKAVALEEKYVGAWVNLGVSWSMLSNALEGRDEDPAKALAAAVDAYGRALELRPQENFALSNLGLLEANRASRAYRRGQDPRPSLERAESSLRRALELRPGHLSALANLAETLVLIARVDAEGGGPEERQMATAKLAESRRLAHRLLELDGDAYYALAALMSADLLEADWAFQAGEDPAAPLTDLIEKARDGERRQPGWVTAKEMAARAHLLRAKARLRAGQDPTPQARAALNVLESAPAKSQIRLLRAKAWLVIGESARPGLGADSALREARKIVDSFPADSPLRSLSELKKRITALAATP